MNPTALSMYAAFGLLATGALPITAALRGIYGDDGTHRRAGRSLRMLARAIVGATPAWKFGVDGSAPTDIEQRPCVVVANHRSLADPFLLAYLPFDQRFVAKAQLFKTPLVGWLLRLGGDIQLQRGDHASSLAMQHLCAATLAQGLSVTLFPEGTRTKGDTVGEFRNGAFRIALASGARILPVALHGTATCIGHDGPRRATARAQILAPIEVQGRGLDELRVLTRNAIVEALEHRRQLGTARLSAS